MGCFYIGKKNIHPTKQNWHEYSIYRQWPYDPHFIKLSPNALFTPPNDLVDEAELDKLLKQLPKSFILMGDFNSQNNNNLEL